MVHTDLKLKVEYANVDKLAPYAGNAKEHPDWQVEQIMNSIDQFGMSDPVGVWTRPDGVLEIVEGHGRVLACKELGIERVPVIRLDHLDDDARRAYALAHNQLTMNSGFDMDMLAAEMDLLGDFDMSEFGFDIGEIIQTPSIGDVDEDDYEIEVPEDPRTKRGDVYKLGKHRLMCGSSTDASDMEKLTGGGSVQLLLTDPPYGISYVGKTADALTIENDEMEDGDFLEFLSDFLRVAQTAMDEGAAFYIFHADSKGKIFRQAVENAGMTVRENLIWVKQAFTLGRQDYQWRHEPCLYGWKDGAAHSWYSDRKQSTVLEFDRPMRNAEHPTMKPVAILAYLIGNSTAVGDVVLDCFGGSGSTLVACEQTGRKCYSMELDPKYCDVIVDRWETLTGEKAELL